MTYKQKLEQYEKIKKILSVLPPREYEKMIIKAAEKLKI